MRKEQERMRSQGKPITHPYKAWTVVEDGPMLETAADFPSHPVPQWNCSAFWAWGGTKVTRSPVPGAHTKWRSPEADAEGQQALVALLPHEAQSQNQVLSRWSASSPRALS